MASELFTIQFELFDELGVNQLMECVDVRCPAGDNASADMDVLIERVKAVMSGDKPPRGWKKLAKLQGWRGYVLVADDHIGTPHLILPQPLRGQAVEPPTVPRRVLARRSRRE